MYSNEHASTALRETVYYLRLNINKSSQQSQTLAHLHFEYASILNIIMSNFYQIFITAQLSLQKSTYT